MINKDQILSTFSANIKSERLSEFLDEADKIIIETLAKNFEQHSLTGKLIADISTDVIIEQGGFIVDYLSYKYGAYLNSGVKPARIPYQRGSGAQRSLYIEALMKYVKLRMSIGDERKQKSIAFAIAETQKKKGMPIRTGGEGTKWADITSEQSGEKLLKSFENISETYIIQGLTELSKKYNVNNDQYSTV